MGRKDQSHSLPARALASTLISRGQRSWPGTTLPERKCFLWVVLRHAVQNGPPVCLSRYVDGMAVMGSLRDSLQTIQTGAEAVQGTLSLPSDRH